MFAGMVWLVRRKVKREDKHDGGIVMNVIFGAIIGGFAMHGHSKPAVLGRRYSGRAALV
jgi:hypothetical protein